jgi:prepilin-type N-terminal cleavage/methylation domain-containing protein
MKHVYKGFTLIEMLVVVLIIATLAAVALVSASSARLTARDAKRKADIRSIATALETYITQRGSFPTSPDYNGKRALSVNTEITPGLDVCNFGDERYSWQNLQQVLAAFIQLPVDPVNSETAAGTTGCGALTYAVQYNGDVVETYGWLENRDDPDRHELRKYQTNTISDCVVGPLKGARFAGKPPFLRFNTLFYYTNTPVQCP